MYIYIYIYENIKIDFFNSSVTFAYALYLERVFVAQHMFI